MCVSHYSQTAVEFFPAEYVWVWEWVSHFTFKKPSFSFLVPSQVHACVCLCVCTTVRCANVFLVVSQEGGNLFFFGATDSAPPCVRTRCLRDILNNCFTSVQRARMCTMHHSAQQGFTFMVRICAFVCGWLYLSVCMGLNNSSYEYARQAMCLHTFSSISESYFHTFTSACVHTYVFWWYTSENGAGCMCLCRTVAAAVRHLWPSSPPGLPRLLWARGLNRFAVNRP